MKFEDDEPIVCDQCGQTISAGDYYYRWNEHNLCSEDCVKDAMYDEFSCQVDEESLLTAEDKEIEYADMTEEK